MAAVVSISEARGRNGLRLVTRRGVPTPWAQAAKGLFEVKGLEFVLAQESESDPKGAQVDWVGDAGAPHVAYDDERIRSGWVEILFLAERLAPERRLIPAGEDERVRMFGLAHEVCGEMGLAWCLRLQMIARAYEAQGDDGPLPRRLADYLGAKYGYHPDTAAAAPERVRAVLGALSRALGDRDWFFDGPSALDVYWGTFGNMFLLLSDDELPIGNAVRKAWAAGGGAFTEEVPANLRAHHRRVYQELLSLPVQL